MMCDPDRLKDVLGSSQPQLHVETSTPDVLDPDSDPGNPFKSSAIVETWVIGKIYWHTKTKHGVKNKTRLVVISTRGVPLSQPHPPSLHILGAALGHGRPLLANSHNHGN